MVEQRGSQAGVCCGLLPFISYVFVCISLTHANNDIVYTACGHTLRDVMIADLLVPVCVAILYGIVFGVIVCSSCNNGSALVISNIIFLLLGTVCLLCLGAITVNESVNALGNSSCISAMSSQEGGINSPSANLGSPLLAIMGFVVGVPYIIVSVGLVVVIIIFTCVFMCSGGQKNIEDFFKSAP